MTNNAITIFTNGLDGTPILTAGQIGNVANFYHSSIAGPFISKMFLVASLEDLTTRPGADQTLFVFHNVLN